MQKNTGFYGSSDPSIVVQQELLPCQRSTFLFALGTGLIGIVTGLGLGSSWSQWDSRLFMQPTQGGLTVQVPAAPLTVMQAENTPRKPTPVFVQFLHTIRPSLVEKYPDKNVAEIGQIAGAQWKEMTPSQKQPYLAEYQEAKDRYEQAKASGAIITPVKVKRERKKSAAEKKEEAPQKPKRAPKKLTKRAPSAYLLFSAEARSKMASIAEGVKPQDVMKELAMQWKSLPAKEKAKYETEAA
eukprot:EG_transcript_25764